MKHSFWLLGVVLLFNSSCTYYFSREWRIRPDKSRLAARQTAPAYTPVDISKNEIVKHWAQKPLPDWIAEGKIAAPRVLTGKLLAGVDVPAVNEYIIGKKPWGRNGTDWAFNPHGDYDFSEVPLVGLLYLFGDRPDILTPAAKSNLLNVLLTHSGNKVHVHSPGTLGLMRETENHIFMGETSRYLKNQWLQQHGDTSLIYDNYRNGLDTWWLALLQQKLDKGFYEFNANPYAGYSLTALLTFYTFCGNQQVKEKCGEVLDRVFTDYAYGSLQLRRYPPFRRRMQRGSSEDFANDPVTSIVKVLLQKTEGRTQTISSEEHTHHALVALISSYKLPEATVKLLKGEKPDYFITKGHGRHSSPEIYSGNADYLLSAGGMQRGKISQIAPRQTVLLLNDSAKYLNQCFYIKNSGKMPGWNNTGVGRQFAVGPGEVQIPKQYAPVAEGGNWKIFKPYTNKPLLVLVHNLDGIGMIAVIPTYKMEAQQMLDKLIAGNAGSDFTHEVYIPFDDLGHLEFDLKAPKKLLVITAVNGQRNNRKVDKLKP